MRIDIGEPYIMDMRLMIRGEWSFFLVVAVNGVLKAGGVEGI